MPIKTAALVIPTGETARGYILYDSHTPSDFFSSKESAFAEVQRAYAFGGLPDEEMISLNAAITASSLPSGPPDDDGSDAVFEY